MGKINESFKRARGDRLIRQLSEQQTQHAADVDRRLDRLEGMVRDLAAAQAKAAATTPPPVVVTPAVTPIERHAPRTKIDRSDWSSAAQEGELGFHVRNSTFRGHDDTWQKTVRADWETLGFGPQDFEGKFIIDVGAGSRLRSLYFDQARVAVIEPLADRFQSDVEWSDLDQAEELYAIPAEEFVPELEGRADFLFSLNALDHGFDMAASIKNIRRYIKDDGWALLSMDMHDVPDHMHPLVLNDDIMREIYDDAGFDIERSEVGRRWHGTVGPPSIAYWLTPRV